MTNAEKYLKENVDIHTLSKEIISFMNGVVEDKYIGMIEDFFNCPVKPTLSEEEKVILKVISESCSKIYRDLLGHIRLDYKSKHRDGLCGEEIRSFDNLFQFIKNGEEYKISDLLGDGSCH